MKLRTALGQDSHRFEAQAGAKPLVLGGVHFVGEPGLEGNSDADVIFHALCNAISGLSGVNILGSKTDAMCAQGIKDSAAYVKEALKTLGPLKLSHCSVSLEGARPKLSPRIDEMRQSLANLLGLELRDIGLTATSGEALTAFGRGEGIQALVLLSAMEA